jgi:cohesin loading factor subunit SCC2
VIRIMKEMCEKRPDFDKVPEMCARIIRRVTDEEGIRKLINESFHSLWLQTVRERDSIALIKKVG